MAQDPNAKTADKTDLTKQTPQEPCTENETEQSNWTSLSGLKKKAMESGIDVDKYQKKAEEFTKDIQEKAKSAQEAAKARLTMEGQLAEGLASLTKFLNPDIEVEKQIPVALMKDAKGIVLLTVVKASLVLGGSVGTGVIMAKLPYGGWSGPCSIGVLGGQFGLNIGAQKTDFVMILRNEAAVKMFTGKGQLKFSGDASIAAGPLGRNAQIGAGINEKGDVAAVISYGESKGLYIGVAFEGQGITARGDCNEAFYGKKLKVGEILSEIPEKVLDGDEIPESVKNADYAKIVELLDNYIMKQDEVTVKKDNDDQKEQ